MLEAVNQARALLTKARSWRDVAAQCAEGSHERRNALAVAAAAEMRAKALRPAVARLALAIAALEWELSDHD